MNQGTAQEFSFLLAALALLFFLFAGCSINASTPVQESALPAEEPSQQQAPPETVILHEAPESGLIGPVLIPPEPQQEEETAEPPEQGSPPMQEETKEPECIDSDGGEERFMRGRATLGNHSETDYCIDSEKLVEFYCADGEITQKTLVCGINSYCYGGTCIKQEPEVRECTDSDKGKDIYRRGTTSNGQDTQTDYCTSSYTVREYYCLSGYLLYDNIDCEYGYCSEGYCRYSDYGKPEEEEPSFPEKVHLTPDLTQTDSSCDLPNGGGWHCGPTSASNAMMWLSKKGYPKLGKSGSKCEVVELLSTEEYMDTNELQGTGPNSMIGGLSAYIEDAGYSYSRLDYQGWRPLSSSYDKVRSKPSLSDLCSAVEDPGTIVVINNGWYTYDSSSKEYTRVGGHWVTLVGCGFNEYGEEDGSILIIHDPAPRAGKEFANEFVRVAPIPSGRELTGTYSGLGDGISASGYYLMEGGMHIKSIADVAILDGAVILEMD